MINTYTNQELVTMEYQIHDNLIPLPNNITIFNNNEYNFGILNITSSIQTDLYTIPKHICFTIDCSASMFDDCADNRTKMQHILYTLENILYLCYTQSTEKKLHISIFVQSFDENTYPILNIESIKNEKLDELITQIKTIRPKGSTNIYNALEQANIHIQKYQTLHPTHDITHLFLTDGQITEGIQDKEQLFSLVQNNWTTIFIGYGTDHDSHLLSYLSNTTSNEYRFIDTMEKASIVYGEIIHNILYKTLNHVCLHTLQCEIYNFITNQWENTLHIGHLTFEQTKTFHLRIPSIHNQTIIELSSEFNHYFNKIIIQTPHITLYDLTRHIFRQKTQELLYKVRKYNSNIISPVFNTNNKIKRCASINTNTRHTHTLNHTSLNNEEKLLKQEIQILHSILITYISNTTIDEQHHAFVKSLADDLYIIHLSIGHKISNMYVCARQSSQGRQYSYTCNNIEPLINDTSNDEIIQNYTLSDNISTCNTTQNMMHTINTINKQYTV